MRSYMRTQKLHRSPFSLGPTLEGQWVRTITIIKAFRNFYADRLVPDVTPPLPSSSYAASMHAARAPQFPLLTVSFPRHRSSGTVHIRFKHMICIYQYVTCYRCISDMFHNNV